MAVDPERHARVVAVLRAENFDAAICSAPTEVLLRTGYRLVIGSSIAIFTADGEVHVLWPEDEYETAANSSHANLTDVSPWSFSALCTPAEVIRKPLISLCKRLSLSQAKVGMERERNLQPASYAVTVDHRSTPGPVQYEGIA